MPGRSCTRLPYLGGSADENGGALQMSPPISDQEELPATNRCEEVVCGALRHGIDLGEWAIAAHGMYESHQV
jgi:hypothetical protein